jgi:hypothetical protein
MNWTMSIRSRWRAQHGRGTCPLGGIRISRRTMSEGSTATGTRNRTTKHCNGIRLCGSIRRVSDPSCVHSLCAVQIDLSEKLWRYGFFFLPFLWLVNYAFFRHSLESNATPAHMKRDVKRSIVAFGIAFSLWVLWLILFYANMRGWAERLMLLQPSTNVLKA